MRAPATRYVVVGDGKHSAFGMRVPDMPGCTSTDETLADLLANAQEALTLWAVAAIDGGEKVPKPRTNGAGPRGRRRSSRPRRGAPLATVPLLPGKGCMNWRHERAGNPAYGIAVGA